MDSQSYIGINGITVVDQEAKDTLHDTISNCSIPYIKFILKRWKNSWDQEVNNNLHEALSLVNNTHCFYVYNH